MDRAQCIADILLEVEGRLAPRGSIYVLSGNTGQYYTSLNDYVARVSEVPAEQLTPEVIHNTVDSVIERGTVIVQQPDHGKLVVYAKGIPVPITTQQLHVMQSRFHVVYLRIIAWARDMRNRPVAASFDKVFGATKTMDMIGKQKDKLEKQAERADKDAERRAVSSGRLRKWLDDPNWKEEFAQTWPSGPHPDAPPLGPMGYGEPTPPAPKPASSVRNFLRLPSPAAPAPASPSPAPVKNQPSSWQEKPDILDSLLYEQAAPFDLGIIPARSRHPGVQVAQIAPGSPASNSVLRVGDIIRQAGPFTGRAGAVLGPYRIDRPSELQRVLGWLREGTAFPLKCVRGSGYVEVVLLPVRKQ